MQQSRIDVHCHAIPPVYRTAVTDRSFENIAVRVPDWSPNAALELMDRNYIAASVVSISVPGTHFGDDAEARHLSRQCNEYMADCIAKWPRRFGAFADLPLPDIEGAITEATYALGTLKLDGVALFTSYSGVHLGHPKFDPLLEVLDAHQAVTFIHPTAHPSNRELDLNFPAFLVEYTFDTTRCAVNLILSATLDRFPNIRFILSHAGGTLPFLSWRVAEVTSSLLTQPRLMKQYPLPFVADHARDITPALFMERVSRFWYDTANAAGPQVMASLQLVSKGERILFGTDWPYVNLLSARRHVADRHVFDHAPPQRGHVFGHRNTPV